jgi:K+-sensing histidine kinase KdpD
MNETTLEQNEFQFLKMVESVILAVDVEVKLSSGCCDFSFNGDSRKLERALTNILENAKYEKEKNKKVEIWINLRKKADLIQIEIGNSGSKVDERILSSIFNDFTSSGKPEGTGLGLSITKKFITLHNGKIRCENKSDNVIFTIDLPI